MYGIQRQVFVLYPNKTLDLSSSKLVKWPKWSMWEQKDLQIGYLPKYCWCHTHKQVQGCQSSQKQKDFGKFYLFCHITMKNISTGKLTKRQFSHFREFSDTCLFTPVCIKKCILHKIEQAQCRAAADRSKHTNYGRIQYQDLYYPT